MEKHHLLRRAAVLLSVYQLGVLGILAAVDNPAAPSPLSPEVSYGTGTWDPSSLGNHRAVLTVAAPADAVRAQIPWRRDDAAPEKKNVIVVRADTGLPLTNVLLAIVTGPLGDIVFQAPTAGTYYAYYLPSISRGRNYPTSSYQPPVNHADAGWLAKNGLALGDQLIATLGSLPAAKVTALEAIDDFNRFDPMEVAATADEEKQLLAAHAGESFLLFPEDRMRPIRMTDHLPVSWIKAGLKAEFGGTAAPGEFYAFQVGVYAVADITDLAVRFDDLHSADGRVIPATALRCINTGGTNWTGIAFTKHVSVAAGRVQALWCGVQIPDDAAPGTFAGHVTVQPAGLPAQTVTLTVTVAGSPLADHGDSVPQRQSRLRWLDSTLAQDDEVVQPFIPMHRTNDTISILGRQLTVSPAGLPGQIVSYFCPEGTHLEATGTALLTSPMELVAEETNGQRCVWSNGPCTYTKETDGGVDWVATSTAGSLKLEVRGHLEFDGFGSFMVTFSSAEPVDLRDLRLELPMVKAKARYLMGLGFQGARRPTSFDWNWNLKLHQDSAWLGDTDAGLRFELKGENFEPPLLTNFYEDKPLNMPPAWYNGGKGGITLRETNDTLLVSCFGGARRLEAGQQLHFDFDLLLTPFKPLNTQKQWSRRFFHSYQPVADVVKSGANTINIHHASDPNPYINYPFLHVKQMRDYVDQAHAQNLKVKIYYTIRELSNHAAELPALLSLGDEIFPTGKGGGDAWLQEHVRTNYLPGWFVPQWKDAALIDKGSSRWDNYYVEGLAWLVKNVGIDGLYIDDLAYDRTTMKRVRKVLDRGNPGSLIDFHSANQYDPHDGFGSCANVYMEQFPYLDRLWFGEYFNPDMPPDFWLIEMSGIPYGMMGEMLQDGGNRWRGMLYGMTSRIPYQGSDPSPIWKIWDEFKIQDSQMYGYWSPRCPVHTDNTNILATAYVGKGKTLLSVASWAPADAPVQFTFDWTALGIDPAKAVLVAPDIAGFQSAAQFKPTDAIPVAKGKGWLFYVMEQ